MDRAEDCNCLCQFGLPEQMPQTARLKQEAFMFHSSEVWKSGDQGASIVRCCGKSPILVSLNVQENEREKQVLSCLSLQGH